MPTHRMLWSLTSPPRRRLRSQSSSASRSHRLCVQAARVLDRPGYDPETKLIYSPSEDVKVDVPFEPSEADVEAAVGLLRELYKDFPFVDDASFANMLALTI